MSSKIRKSMEGKLLSRQQAGWSRRFLARHNNANDPRRKFKPVPLEVLRGNGNDGYIRTAVERRRHKHGMAIKLLIVGDDYDTVEAARQLKPPSEWPEPCLPRGAACKKFNIRWAALKRAIRAGVVHPRIWVHLPDSGGRQKEMVYPESELKAIEGAECLPRPGDPRRELDIEGEKYIPVAETVDLLNKAGKLTGNGRPWTKWDVLREAALGAFACRRVERHPFLRRSRYNSGILLLSKEKVQRFARERDPTHSPDFSSVTSKDGTEYKFASLTQRAVVEFLWNCPQCTAHNATIEEHLSDRGIKGATNRFLVSHVFRDKVKGSGKHPAWGRLIVPEAKGVVRLVK